MEKIKRYTMFVIIMAIYYYYRITTAVLRPNKPVMTFFFWKNERELIERNTMLLFISLIVGLIWFIFGFKCMVISVSALLAVMGCMTIYQLIKIWRNGRKEK